MSSVYVGPTVGAGGGTPGGDTNDVQFNDAGAFGGFGSWDGSLLTVPGITSDGFLTLSVPVASIGALIAVTTDEQITSQSQITDELFQIDLTGSGRHGAMFVIDDTGTSIVALYLSNGAQIGLGTYSNEPFGLFANYGSNAIEVMPDGSFNVYGSTVFSDSIQLANGKSLRGDTTTAHTFGIDVYDVDGAAYKRFITGTNGNTPDLTIAPPTGSTLVVQATTYKSSDGSTGATAGPFTVISSITVKDGLVTALTGS